MRTPVWPLCVCGVLIAALCGAADLSASSLETAYGMDVQALIITEDTDLEQMDPTDFSPYPQVQAAALEILEEAIAIAEANSFTIPGSTEWINGVQLTSADLIRVINSYYARSLAYTPRDWNERAAVDWDEVLRRIDDGIQEDLAPEGLQNVWESNMRRLYARVRARPPDHVRPDYMALGPADTSGAFQQWFATPSADRMPFQIVTPDRRIQGDEDPTRPGRRGGPAHQRDAARQRRAAPGRGGGAAGRAGLRPQTRDRRVRQPVGRAAARARARWRRWRGRGVAAG